MQTEITREFIEQVEEAIARHDKEFILSRMGSLYPADITTVLYELDTDQTKYILDILDASVGAEILTDLDSDVRTDFLSNYSSPEIARFIDQMDSDDAVDILNELSVQVREEVIAHLQDQKLAANIVDLLHYDEDCAGGLMAKEFIKVNINWRVRQCIEEVRRQAEQVEKIYSMYVVNNQDILMGRLSTKSLLLATDNTLIEEIYEPDVISIESYKDEEEVVEVMQKYDLEAIPVVNVQGKLLGRITFDDVVDVIQERAELDRQLMAGITEDVEEDDSVLRLARARLPWLLIGMVGGLIGAKFMGLFESDIALIPAMAFFIPLITATGGNVGIQSSSIIIQSLANKSGLIEKFRIRLFKVIAVAVLNALVISLLVFLASLLFFKEDMNLSLVVGIALFSVVMLASFTGTITPIILDKFGVNPAMAAGPFITTANDLLGIAVYFMVAHLLYSTI